MTEESEPIKSKQRLPWTPSEVIYALVRIGDESLDSIGTHLQRSPAAVQEKMRKAGVNLFANDGRVTAVELAQRVGLPIWAVLEMLKMGLIKDARKVGRIWRINYQAEDLSTVWNRTSPGYLTKGLATREGAVRNCLNCGNTLAHANWACSKKCHGEFQRDLWWKAKYGITKPGSDFPPYLRLGFQDWLTKDNVGLMSRDINLSLQVSRGATLTSREEIMVATLEQFKGYVVPKEVINADIFNGQNHAHLARLALYKLRRKLQNPEVIFTSNHENLGWGLGVKSLDCSTLELKLLRQLWQKEGVFTSAAYLGQNIYVNLPQEDIIKRVSLSVSDLRHKLASSGYEILAPNRDNTRYGKRMYKLQKR